jgi:hypothetical protein
MTKQGGLGWRLIMLPIELTTAIDAWAQAHGQGRTEALQHLVGIALKHEAVCAARSRDCAIERLAESQMETLIDAETPTEERERRIHRLTEGPPEFVDLRIDLPRKKKECFAPPDAV